LRPISSGLRNRSAPRSASSSQPAQPTALTTWCCCQTASRQRGSRRSPRSIGFASASKTSWGIGDAARRRL